MISPEDLALYQATRALQRLNYEHLHEYEVDHLQRATNSRCRVERQMNGYTFDLKAKWQMEKERMIRKALGLPKYARKEKVKNL